MEYRRAVAAYAAAHGLAGTPLLGFGVPIAHARVELVALETDDPVDDIRIEMADGWACLVQAKRTLRKGTAFDEAVAQWAAVARRGLDPACERMVIVTASLSGPLETLRRVLDRYKTDAPGAPSAGEAAALAHLDARLTGLTDEQRELVLRCAYIHVLDVEEGHFAQSREGMLLLGHIVHYKDVARAWAALVAGAGLVARRRGGLDMRGWTATLTATGIEVDMGGSSLAAHLARRQVAVERYMTMVRRRAETLDLRGLGAALPLLPVAEVDADVKVLRDPSDSRSEAELLWAVLRRGRTVLTGLPGGGKSTALRILAADLSAHADTSLPLLASLREVDRLDRSRSFRERLLTVALRDVDPDDLDLVREEVTERLRRGGLMLLLDSLDETHSRRGAVVSEIEAFLDDVSPDIDVLLATRDIAYGQAATLGWPAVRLAAPENMERTVSAILEAAARHRREKRPVAWTETRRAWVLDALRGAPVLRETPLLPVLLTLLAVERDKDDLPRDRARILAEVAHDVGARREADKREPFRLGELEGPAATSAARQVFSLEASVIMAAGGQCEVAAVFGPVAEALAERWGLSKGQAHVAAEAAVRFWDESGIFVMSGAPEIVAPRVALFAEIGDAIRVADGDVDDVFAWVTDAIARKNVEALVLAAGLSPVVAREFAVAAARNGNHEVLAAALRAVREGATPDAPSIEALLDAVLVDAATGDREGWTSWLALSHLPAFDRPGALLDALPVYPREYQTLGRAVVGLRWTPRPDLEAGPDILLDVLRLHRFPRLQRRVPRKGVDLWDLRAHDGFVDTVGEAAEVVIGLVEEAVELVIHHLREGPQVLQTRLEGLLASRGYGAQAAAALADQRAEMVRSLADWTKGFDQEAPTKLLQLLASRPHAPLDRPQRVRLDEFADFVETLNLNDASTWVGRSRHARLSEVVDLVAVLGGFDLGVIAAEAAVVLQRMARIDSRAPFFALFDGASDRPLDRWEDLSDRDAAIDLLVDMFSWGRGNAWVAASALWSAPVATTAAPLLRTTVPLLVTSTEHQRIAATTLASLSTVIDIPEPAVWADDPNPVLRAVAAQWCVSTTDGRVSVELARFLADPDGNVRTTAVRSVFESEASDRDETLAGVAGSANPGWMCLSCRTVNPAGLSSCAAPKCYRAAARPAEDAKSMLEGTYKSYD